MLINKIAAQYNMFLIVNNLMEILALNVFKDINLIINVVAKKFVI